MRGIKLILVLVLVSGLLSACFRQPTPKPTEPSAIFTDADIDKAKLQVSEIEELLETSEINSDTKAKELQSLGDNENKSQFSPTAVLAGAKGFVYYIEHDQILRIPGGCSALIRLPIHKPPFMLASVKFNRLQGVPMVLITLSECVKLPLRPAILKYSGFKLRPKRFSNSQIIR